MRDAEVQRWVERAEWAGRLGKPVGDYLYIVESNLGANKANCCVDREVRQEVDKNKEKLTITWENKNEFDATKPPVFWGGQYVDYVRVIIPAGAEVQRVKVVEKELRRATEKDFVMPNSLRQEMSTDMYNIEYRDGLQIIGFWANVPAKEIVTAELNYESGSMNNAGYKVLVKRPPGIEGFQYKLLYNGKLVVSEWIDRDKTIWTK